MKKFPKELLVYVIQELRKAARDTTDPRYCNILLLDETEALVSRIVQMHTSATHAPIPIPMVLFCPNCQEQHIDKPSGEWANPPHRSHECQKCGCVWRPADVPTNGVEFITSKG